MKIKESITHEDLLNAGFEMVDGKDEDISNYYEYSKCIGYSRRGQTYHFVIKNKEVFIIATEPDGSGGACTLDKDDFILLMSITD